MVADRRKPPQPPVPPQARDAEVNVIMTRHGDDTLSLSERSAIANNAKRLDGGIGADLFVSIHHNAGSRTSNYPSVWYHGAVDDNEPDMDVARYIAIELGREMRTQVAKTSPIFSSHLMYQGGFGVLRTCHVPGVLCESSFFSEPDEEQRLIQPLYNLREAYAIYLGLANWAYAGRPTQTLPKLTPAGAGLQVTTTLDPGLPPWWGSDRSRILASSVEITFDGRAMPRAFDGKTGQLTATLPRLSRDTHVLVIHHANFLKNHNWPQRYELSAGGNGQVTAKALAAWRGLGPPTGRSGTRPTSRSSSRSSSRPTSEPSSPRR